YQQVFYQYPDTEAGTNAAAALAALRGSMGASYPPPMSQQMLARANKLLAVRDYVRARSEFRSLISQLGGAERDQARVGVGAADYLRGEISSAYQYLRSLNVSDSEADAERLYYLTECARRLTDDDDMLSAVKRLNKLYMDTPWR